MNELRHQTSASDLTRRASSFAVAITFATVFSSAYGSQAAPSSPPTGKLQLAENGRVCVWATVDPPASGFPDQQRVAGITGHLVRGWLVAKGRSERTKRLDEDRLVILSPATGCDLFKGDIVISVSVKIQHPSGRHVIKASIQDAVETRSVREEGGWGSPGGTVLSDNRCISPEGSCKPNLRFGFNRTLDRAVAALLSNVSVQK